MQVMCICISVTAFCAKSAQYVPVLSHIVLWDWILYQCDWILYQYARSMCRLPCLIGGHLIPHKGRTSDTPHDLHLPQPRSIAPSTRCWTSLGHSNILPCVWISVKNISCATRVWCCELWMLGRGRQCGRSKGGGDHYHTLAPPLSGFPSFSPLFWKLFIIIFIMTMTMVTTLITMTRWARGWWRPT